MKKGDFKKLLSVVFLLVLAVVSFSCFSKSENKEEKTTTETTTSAVEQGQKAESSGKDVIVIGYTSSQTGKFATESREQSNGLNFGLKM